MLCWAEAVPASPSVIKYSAIRPPNAPTPAPSEDFVVQGLYRPELGTGRAGLARDYESVTQARRTYADDIMRLAKAEWCARFTSETTPSCRTHLSPRVPHQAAPRPAQHTTF